MAAALPVLSAPESRQVRESGQARESWERCRTLVADKDEEFASYMHARQASWLRLAHLLCGDHAAAEDLAQNAFTKLYLSWDKVRDREALDGWMRRVIVNENNSLWRRAFKRRERATEELPEDATHDSYDDGLGAKVWEFVNTLPPKQRSVVVLRYYENLSEAEIAHTLGISAGTVKSQASRALAALRQRAPDHFGPEEVPR